MPKYTSDGVHTHNFMFMSENYAMFHPGTTTLTIALIYTTFYV